MRRKFAFLVAVFCATVLAMAVQKPVFMAWYAAEAAGAGFGGWMEVLWHGLTLDMTVAGYVTALPLLAVLLSLWVRIPERVWRGVLTAYFALIAVVTAVIFAVDVALYEHWSEQDLETIRRKAAQAHMSQSDYVTACCLGKRIVILDGLREVLRQQKAIGNNLNQLAVLANMGKVQFANLDTAAQEFARINTSLRELQEGGAAKSQSSIS